MMLQDKFREGWPRETVLALECLAWSTLAVIGIIALVAWHGMDATTNYCTGFYVPTKQVARCVLSVFGDDGVFAAGVVAFIGLCFGLGALVSMQKRTALVLLILIAVGVCLYAYWVSLGHSVPVGIQITLNVMLATIIGLTVITMIVWVLLFGMPGLLG